jgi:Holliday junction resolvasome RuvABC ATP-dependent DNA helicase subunit
VPGPLSGLEVVDFSRVLAGPLCARTLQDLGAEVIKLEPPRADVSLFSAPVRPNGVSGYYAQQNAGKRNLSLDLNDARARDLALRHNGEICGELGLGSDEIARLEASGALVGNFAAITIASVMGGSAER